MQHGVLGARVPVERLVVGRAHVHQLCSLALGQLLPQPCHRLRDLECVETVLLDPPHILLLVQGEHTLVGDCRGCVLAALRHCLPEHRTASGHLRSDEAGVQRPRLPCQGVRRLKVQVEELLPGVAGPEAPERAVRQCNERGDCRREGRLDLPHDEAIHGCSLGKFNHVDCAAQHQACPRLRRAHAHVRGRGPKEGTHLFLGRGQSRLRGQDAALALLHVPQVQHGVRGEGQQPEARRKGSPAGAKGGQRQGRRHRGLQEAWQDPPDEGCVRKLKHAGALVQPQDVEAAAEAANNGQGPVERAEGAWRRGDAACRGTSRTQLQEWWLQRHMNAVDDKCFGQEHQRQGGSACIADV
mmetsp:Transcript_33954/g.107901  ORF Transcript_33954/g.107901 Transcript_33954/m.107901 type:complete len:355 (+) Transcript_33954:3225-4289(+)